MPFSKVSKLIAVTLSATLVSLPVFADMTLVLLGTGTPNPVPERAGAASAVIVDGQPWIIDAGPGVVRRVEATRRAGVKALTQPNLSFHRWWGTLKKPFRKMCIIASTGLNQQMKQVGA